MRQRRRRRSSLFSAILLEAMAVLGIVVVAHPRLAVDWLGRLEWVTAVPGASIIELPSGDVEKNRLQDYHVRFGRIVSLWLDSGEPREKSEDLQRH